MISEVKRTTNIISLLIFKSVLNVLKSTAFNIFMLVLGFALGYYSLALKVHYYATVNNNYEYIQKIETHVKMLELMDLDYANKEKTLLELLKQYKFKISHDLHNECESTVGHILYQ